MKEMTLNFNVKVDIGVTPTLEALGNRVLAALWPDAPQPAVAEASEAPTTEAPTTEAPTTDGATEPETAPAEPSPTTPKPVVPIYDDDYLREAMAATRRRLQGADYEKTSATPAGKKLHKMVTGEFKRIAMQLGASIGENVEKPTQLPLTEIRVAFCRSLDELSIDHDGNIVVATPF